MRRGLFSQKKGDHEHRQGQELPGLLGHRRDHTSSRSPNPSCGHHTRFCANQGLACTRRVPAEPGWPGAAARPLPARPCLWAPSNPVPGQSCLSVAATLLTARSFSVTCAGRGRQPSSALPAKSTCPGSFTFWGELAPRRGRSLIIPSSVGTQVTAVLTKGSL